MPKTGHFQPILVNIGLNGALARDAFRPRLVDQWGIPQKGPRETQCGKILLTLGTFL
jgi:hypothetical protein